MMSLSDLELVKINVKIEIKSSLSQVGLKALSLDLRYWACAVLGVSDRHTSIAWERFSIRIKSGTTPSTIETSDLS
jgi:hypothetical protein